MASSPAMFMICVVDGVSNLIEIFSFFHIFKYFLLSQTGSIAVSTQFSRSVAVAIATFTAFSVINDELCIVMTVIYATLSSINAGRARPHSLAEKRARRALPTLAALEERRNRVNRPIATDPQPMHYQVLERIANTMDDCTASVEETLAAHAAPISLDATQGNMATSLPDMLEKAVADDSVVSELAGWNADAPVGAVDAQSTITDCVAATQVISGAPNTLATNTLISTDFETGRETFTAHVLVSDITKETPESLKTQYTIVYSMRRGAKVVEETAVFSATSVHRVTIPNAAQLIDYLITGTLSASSALQATALPSVSDDAQAQHKVATMAFIKQRMVASSNGVTPAVAVRLTGAPTTDTTTPACTLDTTTAKGMSNGSVLKVHGYSEGSAEKRARRRSLRQSGVQALLDCPAVAVAGVARSTLLRLFPAASPRGSHCFRSFYRLERTTSRAVLVSLSLSERSGYA
ncbi:unnamed protein product [Prorocentrum cordatum]|uniref:Uncharacterized protein n=1 Tax=Prorocentrum cordatum TaxID=2364126 RepID=A0ABN9XAU6_9DINO|nr:unnamed protein product [Polarella glacialis]